MKRAFSLLLCSAMTQVMVSASSAQIVVTPTFDVGDAVSSRPPDVAVGTDDSILFTWTEDRFGFSRRFSEAGLALGGRIQFDTSGNVRETAISARPDGTFLVGWHQRDDGSRLWGRHLDATGTPVGTSFLTGPGTGTLMAFYGVAALPTASVFLWRQNDLYLRIHDLTGAPLGGLVTLDTFSFGAHVTALPDGGFLVVWDGYEDGVGSYPARAYDASGAPRGPGFSIGYELRPRRIAVNALGQVVVVGVGTTSSGNLNGVWMRRLDATGLPVGNAVLVHRAFDGDFFSPDVDVDAQGNALVVWTGRNTVTELREPVRVRPYDSANAPLAPESALSEEIGDDVRLARLSNDHFVGVWTEGSRVKAKVVSLCLPPATQCGDGIVHPECEQCDDGPANSDTAPDACRTDCSDPRCSDGTVDSDETCDDTNFVNCDGCSASCVSEPGLVCGDGLPEPSCSQPCDDANPTVGDGCSPQCTIEPAPGGGQRTIDCRSTFVVDNPSNDPLVDKNGVFRSKHRCTDDDTQCDFDGGTPGSCTFHVRVCINASGFADCLTGIRLAGWNLDRPSAKDAAKSPALAVIRSAFAAIVGTIVGPDADDVCSDWVSVAVPMKGEPGDYRRGKIKLKTTGTQYDGARDKDTLTLECIPPELP